MLRNDCVRVKTMRDRECVSRIYSRLQRTRLLNGSESQNIKLLQVRLVRQQPNR
jgi:hypothetical protein